MTSLRATLCGVGTAWCAMAPQAFGQAAASGDPLRALGLTVATSGSARDTLGLLVAAVTRDDPADQAGITTGNRILAVNGQPIRLSAAEIGRRSAADSAISRFVRAVRVVAPAGDVTLKISGGGAIRTIALPLGATAPASDGVPPAHPASAAPVMPAPRAAVPASPAGDARGPATTPAPPNAPASAPQVVLVATPPVVTPPPPATAVPVDSTTTPATPQPVQPSTPAAAAPPVAGAGTVITRGAAHTDESLPRIVEALAQIQLELRRAARESVSLSVSDSLADLEWQLSGIRRSLRALSGASSAADSVAARSDTTSVLARWLRAADRLDGRTAVAPATVTTPATPTPASAAAPRTAAVPPAAAPAPLPAAIPVAPSPVGIELSAVTGDLAAYLGPQGASAVVVVRASDAYEPLQPGDVVLLADGVAPDLERLRATLAAHGRVSLQLLRRGRMFTVVVGDAAR